MSVAACMIVRDGAESIERAIASIRPHVAEVNVLDTGSTDGTLAILDLLAAAPGAPIRVERAEWRDDFAEARNLSFAMASPEHEWLTWLDADDVVEGAVHFDAVIRLAGNAPVIFASYISAVDGEVYGVRPRLVRRDTAPAWHGVLHEELRWSDNSLDIAMVNAHVCCWLHERRDKWASHARNLSILEGDLARAQALGVEPDEGTLFHLGRTLTDARRGLDCLRAFLERTAGQWSFSRVHALELLAEMCPGVGFDRWAAVERAAWPKALAAGAVAGLTQSSPAFWDYVVATFAKNERLRLQRNDRCWCGSGWKLKACCEVDVHWPAVVSTNNERGGTR